MTDAIHDDDDDDNQFISIQFFVIYVPSQHLQGHLQKQHCVVAISTAYMRVITLQGERG
jgi:hypothetical protein